MALVWATEEQAVKGQEQTGYGCWSVPEPTIRQMPETSCMPDSVGKPAPQRVHMISSAIYQLCALGI